VILLKNQVLVLKRVLQFALFKSAKLAFSISKKIFAVHLAILSL